MNKIAELRKDIEKLHKLLSAYVEKYKPEQVPKETLLELKKTQ